MDTPRIGYFGLEAGSEAEANAVAQNVSREESSAKWIVTEQTYPDGRVSFTAWTENTFKRSSEDGQGNPRTDIRFRAVRAFQGGEEVAL
jgi:hypothetical protein